MNILDNMRDIIKHTSNLGLFDTIKIVGSKNGAKISAMDENKTVVVFGDIPTPISGIDSTVGLSRIQILKGYMDNPVYSTEISSVTVVSEKIDGVETPTEIKFDSGDGSVSSYRFMSEAMANERVKIPPFKGPIWDVVITPEKKKIIELSYNYSVLGGFEKRFTVNVKGDTLKFCIGNGPTDRSEMVFARGVSGKFKNQWSFPLAQVLSILKLSDTAVSTTMNFSDLGVLKIDIDSGMGMYSYIVLAAKQ